MLSKERATEMLEDMRDLGITAHCINPGDCTGLKFHYGYAEFEAGPLRGSLEGRLELLHYMALSAAACSKGLADLDAADVDNQNIRNIRNYRDNRPAPL